jgi:pimeloyl-ACP methyl ester carboxylesterase
MKKLLLATTLLISTLTLGQNHLIGHTTITFQDPNRGNRAIETEIYYPATVAGDDETAINEEFPVIVFGHGFVMAWSAYKNLWEDFVPKGYIMVFPRTEGGFNSTDHQEFGWDLQFLVTEMQSLGNDAGGILFNCVAPETALMGHSMGGGAAFLAADSLNTNGNTNLKTLIGLAPAESTTNGVSSTASATKVNVPSLILSGVQDGVTPPADHHIPMYNNLASDCKTIIKIIGGAHCYFANSNAACDAGELFSSSGISISRTEQHQVTFDFVNLWLEYTLKGGCNDFNVFNDALTNSPRINFEQVCTVPTVIDTNVNNNSGVLTAVQGNATYQWIDCDNSSPISGATNITFQPSSNGDYAVEITQNGCTETSNCHTIDSSLGVSNKNNSSLFKLYPNPSTGVINIEHEEALEFFIYDTNLSLVFSSELNSTKQVINPNLKSGIYIWKTIDADSEVKSGKLIVQ